MAKILQIETATSLCSVALSEAGTTIALKELDLPNIHASSLTLFIEELMASVQWNFKDLDAIAISKGPGSYTGLRIGVSTAKGLAFALDKPMIAVDTLKMMAAGYMLVNPAFKGLICPMIDARRMEVFTGIYDHNLKLVEEVSAKIIDDHSFGDYLSTSAISFLGNGAAKCAAQINSLNAHFISGDFNSASNMSALAYEAFQVNDFVDVAYFEPFYLKDFVFTPAKKKLL